MPTPPCPARWARVALQALACVWLAGCGGAAGEGPTDSAAAQVAAEEAQRVRWGATKDRVPPTVGISSVGTPADAKVALAGSATDNVQILRVRWATDRGQQGNAILSGSAGRVSWSAPAIALLEGDNVVTVTAQDASGNAATTRTTVRWTPPPPVGSTACDTATGRVLLVGPGRSLATPSAAAAVAQAGDVVKIDAGDYRGDVATWRANNLTLCGQGGRARLFAAGNNAGGKAIWVIVGSNTTVDSIEFHDATVPDQNGAGIRTEGPNLTVINCGFFDNEDGILGGDPGSTIIIERSEFARGGFGDGQSHNIYIGPADKLVVRSSFFHEAKIGHNFKSRAKETRIENSYFMDGPSGTASYQVDVPNGGAVYLRGNLIQKGPNADNSIMLSYGAEGQRWSVNTLEMVHNTVVMTRSGGSFLDVPGWAQSVRLAGNIWAPTGGASLIGGGFLSANVASQNNLTTSAANFSGADNVAAPNFWPNATVRALLPLPSVLDAAYTADSPRPFESRALTGTGRLIGALQSAP